MKSARCVIPVAFVILSFVQTVNASDNGSGIHIRIHSPFPDLYVGENDSWLIRMENHGKETIPVPDQSPSGQGEFAPPQFHVQTYAEFQAGKTPAASEWKEIESFGYGMKDLVDKSLLGPGQAMEAFSWGLPGQPKTPRDGEKFRMAMQVGPDDFVYSNWITRIRHEEPVTGMRVLHVGDPWGNGAEHKIALSESTHPKYLWFYASNSSDQFAQSTLYRICEVPEGIVPDVNLLDREHGQYVISFPQEGPDTVYFAHRCGLSKSTPWPKGYMSKDYLLTSYPVSAPSPIGFPLALFQEDIQSMPNQGLKKSNSVDRPSKSHAVDVEAKAEEPADMDGSSLWMLATPLFLLAGLVAFLIIFRNQKKQK